MDPVRDAIGHERAAFIAAILPHTSPVMPRELGSIVGEYAFQASSQLIPDIVFSCLQDSRCNIGKLPRDKMNVLCASGSDVTVLDLSMRRLWVRAGFVALSCIPDSVPAVDRTTSLAARIKCMQALGQLIHMAMPNLQILIGRKWYVVESARDAKSRLPWIGSQITQPDARVRPTVERLRPEVAVLQRVLPAVQMVNKDAEAFSRFVAAQRDGTVTISGQNFPPQPKEGLTHEPDEGGTVVVVVQDEPSPSVEGITAGVAALTLAKKG